MTYSVDEKRKRQMHLACMMDYLKNNNFRIAGHSLSGKHPTPLGSRNDIKPLLDLVKEREEIDVIGLDEIKRISIAIVRQHEDLVAHFADDPEFFNALKIILEASLENVHLIFMSDGIIMPEIVEGVNQPDNKFAADLGISNSKFNEIFSQIDFIETKVNASKAHRTSDPKIYLRGIIAKVKKLKPTYVESSEACECGKMLLEGGYMISYWGKVKEVTYFICPACGIQSEPQENSGAIMNFVSGLR